MIDEIIRKTRSCRRFVEGEPISRETLGQLVDLGRLGGSARNVQPLKFLAINSPAKNREIFPLLGWAGYLVDWPGPAEGERPAAYIICLLDTRLAPDADIDLGIATQNILLGATAMGLGGCRIAAFSPALRDLFSLDPALRILLVIALGRKGEEVVLEPASLDGDIRYWRDDDQIHHVPKRSLDEVLIFVE